MTASVARTRTPEARAAGAPEPGAALASMFAAPLLRGLDATWQEALLRAATIAEVPAGHRLCRAGDGVDALCVVLAGAVDLEARRRGDEDVSVVRTARAGDTFGEEIIVPGVARRFTAIAATPARVATIAGATVRRAIGRPGASGAVARERRFLERAIAADVVRASVLGGHLSEVDLELLLDGITIERHARATSIYEPGDRAADCFIVIDGVVQIHAERAGRAAVLAYLTGGDLFGDEDALAGDPRATTAAAGGDTWCARIAAGALCTVSDRNPDLLRRLRRLQRGAAAAGAGALPANATSHVFADLYRMQVARALLVIDMDTCVRCGHCAWSCAEVHGDSRLVRRGDKVITSLADRLGKVRAEAGAPAATAALPARLLLPNTCQHCRNAACMLDCPTGAIGRDLHGEVFIRESLCTGCGNCAKACPWHNIGMAPAAGGDGEVAVKCDLCRGYEAPACVQACPTESIFRVDPSRDFAEVSALLGTAPAEAGELARTAGPRRRRAWWLAPIGGMSIAAAGVGYAMQTTGRWAPGHGFGLAAGILAAVALLALAGYTVPKRLVGRWMRRRRAGRRASPATATPRSRTRPALAVHTAIGMLACAAVAAHAGAHASASPAGALWWSFWIATALGAAGTALYRLAPSRLARIERGGSLPEDLRTRRRDLLDQLYRSTTGRDEVSKTIIRRLLVPYARATGGSLVLLASGRTLSAERRRVRARIERALQGRHADTVDALGDVVDIVVELRALPAQRAVSRALRGWLPLHIVASVVTLALLALHVAIAVAS